MSGVVRRECQEIERGLLKFRQAIDNSQPYLGSHLHLHHLGGETLTNPVGVLYIKLYLPATLLNEMKNKQVRKVLQVFVARVGAKIQNFGHRTTPFDH